MSTPIGVIYKDIQRAQRLADFGFKEDLVTAGLLASAQLSQACDWIDLREDISVVYAGTPIPLPADCMGVLAVLDSDGVLLRRAENYTSGMDEDENFYALAKASAPVASGMNGLSIDEGSFILGGISIDSDWEGEWIEIADQPGCYEIADAATGELTDTYFGPKITNGAWSIRPRDTRTIEFRDDGTYTVVLWHAERPLYKDHQRTVLPARAFQLAVTIHVLGFHEKQAKEAEAYREEYRTALSDAMSRNPRYAPPAGAISNSGNPIRFGRSFR